MEKRKRKYKCSHCKKIVVRISDKKWIKSWCENTDQYTRLKVILPNRELLKGRKDNK